MLLDQHGALSIPIGNLSQTIPWLIRFVLSSNASSVNNTRSALANLLNQAVPSWKTRLARENLADYLIPCHYMRVWENPNGEKAARNEQAFYQKWGIAAEFASFEQVKQLEPALAHSIHHAVLLPHAHRIRDPYKLSQALLKAVLQKGGLVRKENVTMLSPQSQQVEIKTDQAAYIFDKAVVCAGAYSAKLLRSLGVHIPLMAERGYHLNFPQINGLIGGPICSAERNVFISPLEGGLRVVGFSELGGLHLPLKPSRFSTLRQHIGSILPQTKPHLSQASEWMGMRPTLPDSLPIIDTHPNYPQIGFAFGHQHIGVTLAAATAQLITTRMLKPELSQDLSAYTATRFAFTGKFM